MTDKSLKLYSGADSLPVNDYTDEDWTDWGQTELGMAADGGDSTASTWQVRDEGGVIPDRSGLSGSYFLEAHNVVKLTVGSNTLFRGRLGYDDRTQGRQPAAGVDTHSNKGRAVEFTVTLADVNDDLRGIIVHQWARQEETDAARVQALVAAYLSGSPRPTTNLNGSNFVVTGSNTFTVPAKTYSGMTPGEVLQELAELTDKQMFVDVDENLHYHGNDYAWNSPVRISDDPSDLNAVTCVPIDASRAEEARDTLSALRVYWGGSTDGDFHTFQRVDNTKVSVIDYWEDVYNDSESTTWAEASNRASNLFVPRKLDQTSYTVTIGRPGSPNGEPWTSAEIALAPKAGQLIDFKALKARGGRASNGNWLGDTFLNRRIKEVRWTFPGPDAYYCQLILDRPRHSLLKGNGPVVPQPAPQPVADTPGTLVALWDFESHGAPTDTYDTTGTYDSNLQLVAPGSTNLPDPSSAGGWTTASHRASDAVPVTAGTSYTFQTDIKWHFDPGIRDVYINYDGGSGNQQMLVDGSDGYAQHTKYTVTKTFTVPAGKTSLAIWFSPYSGIVVDNMSLSTVGSTATNDPNSLPDGGSSPYYARSDDPRFTADDQHLITRLSERVVNNSGGDLNAGDVVIPDTSYDGHGVTTTTTASLTAARVGVLLEDIADGATGVVLWEGVISTVNDGASTSADGDYLYTSTTAGAAAVSGSRSTGAVGRVVRDDSGNPVYVLWWGVPDSGSGGGGGTFGTPAIVLGTSAAAGSIDEVIRRDATIVAFDATAPTTQAFGDSAATGSAAVAARRDHKHAMPSNPLVGSVSTLNYIISNGNQVLATGVAGDVVVDFACTITGVTLLADQSGSVVVDIWKDTYTNYPPTNADSLIDTGAGGTKPTISSATKSQDTTLAHWTTSISAGDTLRFNVDSATTIRRVAVALKLTRT